MLNPTADRQCYRHRSQGILERNTRYVATGHPLRRVISIYNSRDTRNQSLGAVRRDVRNVNLLRVFCVFPCEVGLTSCRGSTKVQVGFSKTPIGHFTVVLCIWTWYHQ